MASNTANRTTETEDDALGDVYWKRRARDRAEELRRTEKRCRERGFWGLAESAREIADELEAS